MWCAGEVIYAEIWKDAAPAHLVDVAVFCDSDDTHTGTAAEFAGKPENLCPALIQRPNHSAVQPFRLIGPVLGSRPKIPKLVFDTPDRPLSACWSVDTRT